MKSRYLLCAAGAIPMAIGLAQSIPPLAEDDYANGPVSDPVSEMQSRIYTGKLKLAYEPDQGFLRAILQELKISPASQMLVFSKTSLQIPYISPLTPRAVYFNSKSYVAWIKGAPNIEIASVDPKRGPVFYTVRNLPQPRPVFTRQTIECLQCHESTMTDHVPGLTARSVFPSADGVPRLASGSFVTTYQSPFKERWGGWYVTGTCGSERHMGNQIATGDESDSKIDMDRGANVTDLRPYIDTDLYLTPHSDIVALMVAEHQMAVENLITKAGFLTRNALRDEQIIYPAEYAKAILTDSIADRINHACEPLLQAMLCIGEYKLASPVKGDSRFTAEYSDSAPKDRLGRSLSQLDLKTRLLKYRCSPLIYSEAFRGLPKEARSRLYFRLGQILTGKETAKPYDERAIEDRKTILDILVSTDADFANSLKS